MEYKVGPGYSFSKKVSFSVAQLQKMAVDCGDMNFVHHDIERAKKTRFKGIIASGSAISAMFSAMIPNHFSEFTSILGLEMSFKFPAPIKSDTEITMEWQVKEATETHDSKNCIVHLIGIITDIDNSVLVSSEAKILLLPSL